MRSQKSQTTVDDYARILKIPGRDGLPRIIVGGHAVNIWSEHYLSAEPDLRKFVPFHSKDLDLLGTTLDLDRLAKETGLEVRKAENKMFIPSAGYLLLPMTNGESVKVEILKRIHGIQTQEIESKAAELTLHGIHVRVIDPIALLQAKTANAVEIEQKNAWGDRQDEKHMRMMVICTRAYLRESVASIGQEKFSTRDCLDFHEAVLKIALSDIGKKAAEIYGIKWREAFPLKELQTSSNVRLKNFVHKRLARMLDELPLPTSKLQSRIPSKTHSHDISDGPELER